MKNIIPHFAMPTREEIIEVLKTCLDPEIGLDVWTLGLIYELRIDHEKIWLKMTFTTPMCPYGPQLMDEMYNKLMKLPNIKDVQFELTFSPPWQPSAEVRAMLGVG